MSGRWRGRTGAAVLSAVLAAGCTGNESVPAPRPAAADPAPRHDLLVARGSDLYGIDVRRLGRPGTPALAGAVTRAYLPRAVTGLARLGDAALVAEPRRVALVDPANGAPLAVLTVGAAVLGERRADVRVEAVASDGRTGYVAGRFARPADATWSGFVLTVGAGLRVLHRRTFGDVVQALAADARGAVAVLSEGAVVDAVTGRLLRGPDYRLAAQAYSVRRDARGGLWIGVGDRPGGPAYVLTPRGEVALPDGALPYQLVAVPGGTAVVCGGTAAVFVVGRRVRRVAVPRTANAAVVAGRTLYVLSAGTWALTAVSLPSLATRTYPVPEDAALIA